MSWDWLRVEAKLDGITLPPRATLFTVNGTGVTMWDGYPADVARALGDEQFLWQPVGYPSAAIPMGPSVQAGVDELVRLLRDVHPVGPFAFIGYSQGALITCKVWRDHILNPNGDLHHRLPDFFAHITYGNPMRAPGVANGNVFAGQAIPKKLDGAVTGGIAGPDDLHPEETPSWQLDFANDGDLYASCPCGSDPWHNEADAGKVETNIYQIVQKATFLNVISIAKDIFAPIGTVEAIINGIGFAAKGTNAPHWQYNIDAAVRFLRQQVTLVLSGNAPAPVVVPAPAPVVPPPVWVVPPPPPVPAPLPVVPVPSNNGNQVNLASILSFLKMLPKIRAELVTGLAVAGSAVAMIHTVAPALPGNIQAIIASVSGFVAMATNFLKSNWVIKAIDEVGKL